MGAYVDIALVAIAVDPPLSQQDLTLIRTLLDYTPRVAVLPTKFDLLSRPAPQRLTFTLGVDQRKPDTANISGLDHFLSVRNRDRKVLQTELSLRDLAGGFEKS